MKTLLAISPHLDDAVFSAGALLWTAARRGWRVVVATVFTGNVERPTGFALACQLDKGLSPEIDYMGLRREEDLRACAVLGAEVVHLPLLEAPHRGYHSAAALFAEVLPGDPAMASAPLALRAVVADLDPDVVLAPLTIGGHVDHVIVRTAVEEVARCKRVRWWEDWPYLDRAADVSRMRAGALRISPEARGAKLSACAHYASQLAFQFGGTSELSRMLAKQESEWYHRPVTGHQVPRCASAALA